jgi:hypothetical protein
MFAAVQRDLSLQHAEYTRLPTSFIYLFIYYLFEEFRIHRIQWYDWWVTSWKGSGRNWPWLNFLTRKITKDYTQYSRSQAERYEHRTSEHEAGVPPTYASTATFSSPVYILNAHYTRMGRNPIQIRMWFKSKCANATEVQMFCHEGLRGEREIKP